MSVAPSSAAAVAAAGPPPSKPIDLLSGQYSFSYSNLHPVLLLSLLAVSLPRLVADPVSTLLGLAPTVALLQAGYCVVCLPSSGKPVPDAAPKPGAKRTKSKAKAAEDLWARVVVRLLSPFASHPSADRLRLTGVAFAAPAPQPATLSLILTLTLAAPALFIVAVAFGAPLTTHQPHTFLLSLHLALLAVPPLFYVHGLDAATWLRLASVQLPLDEVYGMALGAVVGAWAGAVPIPLDWDRAWQRWPVTVVVGAYAGCVLGKVLGGTVARGLRIKLS